MNQDAPWQLFDLETDPGEVNDIAIHHPDRVKTMSNFHAAWWASVRPMLVNEEVKGSAINPFKDRYWKQFPAEKPAAIP
jgi:arylsulfatase